MKKLLLPIFFLILSCNTQENKNDELTSTKDNSIDIEAELAGLEKSRAGFQLAIKEGRLADRRKYALDVITSGSYSGKWAEFKELRNNPRGQFSYDSLVMRPRETVVLNDSMAYDFGTSSTYYTNETGEPIELIATYLAIMKKDKSDGIWKLHREVSNSRDLE